MALIPFPVQNGLSVRGAERAVPQTSPGGFNLNDQDRELIELMHEQTRCYRGTARRRTRIIGQFLWDPKTIARSTRLKEPGAGDVIVMLPAPQALAADFCDVLAKRLSAKRGSLSEGFDLCQLSTLLHVAARANRVVRAAPAPEVSYHFRPYPSPGGLYPGELYVVPTQVDGLKARPYRYDAQRHLLVEVGPVDGAFWRVDTAEGQVTPACVIGLTTVLSRATAKYGSRGYRVALLEAGHIGQNLTLAATAIGLKSLVYGSFYDSEFETLLGVDGIDEVVLSTVLLGGAS